MLATAMFGADAVEIAWHFEQVVVHIDADKCALATATLCVGAADIAWHFEQVVVHILHSLPPLLADAQASQTHLEAKEEEATVGGCVCFVCIFVLCGGTTGRCANNRSTPHPGHVGDCQKTLVIRKMILALYQGLNIGLTEKKINDYLLHS